MGVIRSQYAGKCNRCGASYAIGDSVYWVKGIKAATCLSCYRNPTTEESSAPDTNSPADLGKFQTGVDLESRSQSGIKDWQIDWSELREISLKALKGERVCSDPTNQSEVVSNLRGSGGSFHGFTADDVIRWLESGYRVPHMILGEPPVPIREKRKLIYQEEGDEFHYDLAVSGDDNYFSSWTKRETIPGLAIVAEIGFSGDTNATVIRDYLSWLCRSVYSLEENGVDCQISIAVTARDTLKRRDGKFRRAVVRVKKENEASDFAYWSAILSPAGTRGFSFALRALWAEAHGKTVSTGMGSSNQGKPWSVEFDSETRLLKIFPKWDASYSFPEEEMTEQLHEALKKTRQA